MALALLTGFTWRADETDSTAKLQQVENEIATLQRELGQLQKKERGVLGEVERLGGELRLREAEFDKVNLELEQITSQIEQGAAQVEFLKSEQSERQQYLKARLRELYRAGPAASWRRLLDGKDANEYWGGLRYAALLTQRDTEELRAFQQDRQLLSSEQGQLESRREALTELKDQAASARQEVASSRRRHTRALNSIRQDQAQRRSAIQELESAALQLGDLVTSLNNDAGDSAGAPVDMRRFRGLLDWPTIGRVSAGFGKIVHPKFKTEVPHPGLDIEGPQGTNIHAVFDGTVVFASWMRGYGLTIILDHGHGVMSIYAHASTLVVEDGQRVAKGQVVGTIGETGSLRGPFLYFELRVDGKAVDPIAWLRER